MVENLHALGIDITVVELSSHVIGAIDSDMAAELHNHIRSKGVKLILNDGVRKVTDDNGGLKIELRNGAVINTDMAILATGVRPENALAVSGGLAIGVTGGILVDEYLRTSNSDIYAVGDAIEVVDYISGRKALIPLASPANKQGRIAADNICGANEKYEGTQGSAVIKVFDMTVATTGLSEVSAQRNAIKYMKSYTYSAAHASYYPGGMPISLKLLFSPDGGRCLGHRL